MHVQNRCSVLEQLLRTSLRAQGRCGNRTRNCVFARAREEPSPAQSLQLLVHYSLNTNASFTIRSRRGTLKRFATALTVLVLFAVPTHAEQVALFGLGLLGYEYEDESLDRSGVGIGIDYLYFGEDNNLFFGASLAGFSNNRQSEGSSFYSMAVGYGLEDSLFTPYVALLQSRFEYFEEETSSDTSLGLGTYIGHFGLRGFTALYGIGADELSFGVGGYYRYSNIFTNNAVIGVSYETPFDDPLNSGRLMLSLGFSF